MMKSRFVAAVLTCGLMMSPVGVLQLGVATAEVDEFSQTVEQASAAYEAGKYEEAAELFKKAYSLRSVSNILYNIARIYEDAGNIDQAIDFYEQFVVAPNVEQAPRKDAVERLKTLREIQALRDKKETPVEPEVKEQPTEVTETPAPPPARPKTLRNVGWATLGVGGATLLGSGIVGLMAGGEHSKFEEATTLEDRRAAASRGESQALIADVLLVTGAVMAVTGAVLVVVGSSGGDEGAATVSLTPMMGAAWGAGLGVSF